ncbi:MAG: SPFH domain-containing protein [Thermodesulfobacteriota bacterium]
MGANNLVFLEYIEWLDDTGQELVHREPPEGSGEIKFGAQLTVRESQAAVLFYKGKACDLFGPGRHTLKTGNVPVVTKILALPWGMMSPLRAEVYFVNLRIFANLKWGTTDPVAFKDSELGLIRLRAHGMFNIQIQQPLLFINTLVGTMGSLAASQVEEYLRKVIVSRLNDLLGDRLDSILNLAGRYEELSQELLSRLAADFGHFGLALSQLYITSITPPAEVQQAIDDQGRLRVVQDLDGLVKLKAAAAMEKAAASQGPASDGMGLGFGLMMPAMLAALGSRPAGPPVVAAAAAATCPDCRQAVAASDRFCPHCGHQLVIVQQCRGCGKNLPANARFCSRCGQPVDQKPAARVCRGCGLENLPESVFCNGCGERL